MKSNHRWPVQACLPGTDRGEGSTPLHPTDQTETQKLLAKASRGPDHK